MKQNKSIKLLSLLKHNRYYGEKERKLGDQGVCGEGQSIRGSGSFNQSSQECQEVTSQGSQPGGFGENSKCIGPEAGLGKVYWTKAAQGGTVGEWRELGEEYMRAKKQGVGVLAAGGQDLGYYSG